MIPELNDCILDHLAIATPSLKETIKVYEDLGLKFSDEREVVKEQGVTTAFAPIDHNAHIELLEPFGESGPIHNFLDKKGAGLHHICFQVTDVKKKSTELEEKGYILLNKEPVFGAGNCLVNFIHPKSTGGVLIEISQKCPLKS